MDKDFGYNPDVNEQDIRWKQRFSNFLKSLERLESDSSRSHFNDLEKQGLIQGFEVTYELAWNTLQDLLAHRGHVDARGPRPVIQQAFKDDYLENGEGWMAMLRDRNRTSHLYVVKIAEEIFSRVRESYLPLFQALRKRLQVECATG